MRSKNMRLNRQIEDVAQLRQEARQAISFDAAFRARLRDLVLWRRDVRRFRRDPLPDGMLESLLELACLAPSVGLSQPWRFVVVEDSARRSAVRENFRLCNAEALAAQPAHRAGNDRLFGSHCRAHDLARSTGAGYRLGLDFDSRPHGNDGYSNCAARVEVHRLFLPRLSGGRGHHSRARTNGLGGTKRAPVNGRPALTRAIPLRLSARCDASRR